MSVLQQIYRFTSPSPASANTRENTQVVPNRTAKLFEGISGPVDYPSIGIAWDAPFIGTVRVNLLTTMNSVNGETWNTVPFTSVDSRTWICKVMALKTWASLFPLQSSLSINGVSWIRDAVDRLHGYLLIPHR
ncbi:MAG: hypothetical protein HC905_00545 [Bacteroidales bacterium]|nr:hypothetical protein [Bacteroidales bacterium]